MSITRKEEFTTTSVRECSSNCDKGHCGCYYSNQNICCRCHKEHLKRLTPLIERRIKWDEKREAEVQKHGNRWVRSGDLSFTNN